MTCYKQIQLTNTAIGSIDTNTYIPYGRITRRINTPADTCNTFVVGSSTADTVTVNNVGFYKVTYSISAVATDAGVVTISLVTDGSSVYTASETAAAGETVNITLPYTIRVYPASSGSLPNVPVTVQIENTGVPLTSGTSNLIIEKV